jgi:alpha-1,6-mannosyltransferase
MKSRLAEPGLHSFGARSERCQSVSQFITIDTVSMTEAGKSRVVASATAVRHRYERVADGVESAIQYLERRYTPLGRFSPGPFQGWAFLWQPAVLGFLALCAILAGSSFSNTPFKLNLAQTWPFGVPSALSNSSGSLNETTLMLSIVLVFGGLVLLMRVWLRLAEVVHLHPGSPVKAWYWILALWSIPMIVAPPLFSRDVFSYAAQGEMTSRHLSPYFYGPFSIGSGPWVRPVDPLWGQTPAPYGPLFLFLDGSIAKLTGHNQLLTVMVLRLLEVLAVALLAWSLPRLASALHRDPGESIVLGALNPLVLLTLIGGAHNDASMAALLVTGIMFAAKRRPILALIFCSLATAIKAPAAIGLLYVAWTWLGSGVRVRDKWKPFLKATIVATIVLLVCTFLAGFGFGWIRNLSTPGTVRSWAAPATGAGLALAAIAHSFGFHVATASMITVTRLIGFISAIGLAIWLLLNAERRGWIRTMALSLLLFVVLGPVVQPWYLVWGLLLMATVYEGREHFWFLLLSITSPFLGLPGGRQLLAGLVHANLALMGGLLAILATMLLLPMGRWTQWTWRETTELPLVEI